MGEFDKGGRVFEMMGDYYRLMKQYFIVDPKDMNTDEFWDNLIRDTEAFCLKHETDNDRFALELAMALITHAEDQARGKGTLCDNRSDHPAEAAFRMMLKFVENQKIGKWKWNKSFEEYECSECGCSPIYEMSLSDMDDIDKYKFCRWCGSKMEVKGR